MYWKFITSTKNASITLLSGFLLDCSQQQQLLYFLALVVRFVFAIKLLEENSFPTVKNHRTIRHNPQAIIGYVSNAYLLYRCTALQVLSLF